MKNYAKTTTLFKAMQTWKSKIWLLAASLVFINSCTLDEDNVDELDLESQQISSLVGKIGISDAANDGIDEFYFLAPTVKESPKFNGRFHGNLKPIVEISDDFEFKTFHQVFSREASGKNKVAVNTSDETYSVTWNTADTKAVKGNLYRVRVRINNRVLGFVDVGIVTPQTKALKHNVIPLTENQSMKIAFRIEDKICPARIEVLPSEVTIPMGGEQQFEAIVYNFYDEVLEDQSIKWSVDDESIASITPSGLASGIEPGEVSVKAQVQDVTGTASMTVIDPNTVTDIDGNVYKTVKIGNQIWMAEDLRVRRNNDGRSIPTNWQSTPSLETYFENPTGNPKAGLLYNLQALFTNKLCPVGWREARQTDWSVLTSFLSPNAGDKVKSTEGWASPNGATNSTGFNAIPNGSIVMVPSAIPPEGIYIGNEWASWWARQSDPFLTSTTVASLKFDSPNIVFPGILNTPVNGLCIRCIKN